MSSGAKIFAFYFIVALLTFGYAASDPENNCGVVRSGCEGPAIQGIFAGVLWPLYWSWTFAEIVRSE